MSFLCNHILQGVLLSWHVHSKCSCVNTHPHRRERKTESMEKKGNSSVSEGTCVRAVRRAKGERKLWSRKTLQCEEWSGRRERERKREREKKMVGLCRQRWFVETFHALQTTRVINPWYMTDISSDLAAATDGREERCRQYTVSLSLANIPPSHNIPLPPLLLPHNSSKADGLRPRTHVLLRAQLWSARQVVHFGMKKKVKII